MIRSEEIDLREGLVYDVAVKGFDSNFWKGDTANLLFDSVKNRIKIGDTGAVPGSVSSYSQYLYGDFEFSMFIDCASPDSSDSEKYFGLRNLGDTAQRGAAYFDLSYDTVADTAATRQFRAVAVSEAGTRQRKSITWDTTWGGAGTPTRFRIRWEEGGYTFLVNDTVYATLGDRPDSSTSVFQVNTSIPQALRLSNRSTDTLDTGPTGFSLVNIRHARKII